MSIALGFNVGTFGAGASIGVAIARNFIGYDVDGDSSPVRVQAYLEDSSVSVPDELTVIALSTQTIAALVIAGSVAVGAALTVGIGAAGSGVEATNKIDVRVRAYIDGDRGGIRAGNVLLSAEDDSAIGSVAVAVALAVALALDVSAGVAVGVTLAHNQIESVVEAYVANAESLVTTAGDVTIKAVANAEIAAVAAAAALAAALSIGFSGGLSGAGADAANIILTKTRAHITSSSVTSADDVKVTAEDTSDIDTTIIGAALSLAAALIAIGAAIGVAIARNLIGWRPDEDGGDDERAPAEVRAWLEDATIDAADELDVLATSDQTIDAFVLSGSVAISGGIVGIGLSGAGSSTINKVAVWVEAAIIRDTTAGIEANSIDVKAFDDSDIEAFSGSAALAGSLAIIAIDVSVAVTIARNEISSEVRAYIVDAVGDAGTAGIRARTGDIQVTADEDADITAEAMAASAAAGLGLAGVGLAGAGADARNVILTKTEAFVVDSELESAGDTKIAATFRSDIHAEIETVSAAVGVGLFGGALAIGIGIAQNYIGWDPTASDERTDYTTNSNPSTIFRGDRVRIVDGGAHDGDLYEYVGEDPLSGHPDLELEQYSDPNSWKQIRGADTAEVNAYLEETSLAAGGDLTIEASADADIDSIVLNDEVAIAAGVIGFAASGAGSTATNKVATAVRAYIDDTPNGRSVSARSIEIRASDDSDIDSRAEGMSIAASIGFIAVSVAVAVSVSSNEIAGEVDAHIFSATVETTGGDLTIQASSDSNSDADSFATAVAAALGLGAGLAGGGATAESTTTTATKGYIRSSTVNVTGALAVEADAEHDAESQVSTTAAGFGLLGFAIAHNPRTIAEISPAVDANLDISTVTAAGSISIVASGAAEADATTEGNALSGGFIAASSARSVSFASITPTVRAAIKGNRVVTSETGSITLLALFGVGQQGESRDGKADAEAEASAIEVGFGAAVAGAEATAEAEPFVSATAAGTLGAQGAITIQARSRTHAEADADEEAGGFVGVGATEARATVAGKTLAQLLGSVTHATDLTIQALEVDFADADADAVTGGVISSTDNESRATSAPEVTAEIVSTEIIAISGTLKVEAVSYPEADSRTDGVHGGAIDVSASDSRTVVSPKVGAHIRVPNSVSNAGLTVVAGTVIVLASVASNPDVERPDYRIVSIASGPDTLRVDGHGLQTGDTVEYDPQSNDLIGGLVDTYVDTSLGTPITVKRPYKILNVYTTSGDVDPNRIALGAVFDADGITPERDTITFPRPHGFQPGDGVVYAPGHATTRSVGGLVPETIYYVLVVDDRTIKLTTSQAAATTPGSQLREFIKDDVLLGNVIHDPGNTFADRVPVTYRAPQGKTFLGRQVAVQEFSDLSTIPDNDQHNIFFPEGHTFGDGQTVIYHHDSGTAIGGLVDGQSYTVEEINVNEITLRPLGGGAEIPITVNGDQRRSSAVHRLVRPGEEAIGGLVDGQTYYVLRRVGMDNDHYMLSLTATDPNPIALDTSAVDAAAVHRIGVEGVDIGTLSVPAYGQLRADAAHQHHRRPGGRRQPVPHGSGRRLALGDLTADRRRRLVGALAGLGRRLRRRRRQPGQAHVRAGGPLLRERGPPVRERRHHDPRLLADRRHHARGERHGRLRRDRRGQGRDQPVHRYVRLRRGGDVHHRRRQRHARGGLRHLRAVPWQGHHGCLRDQGGLPGRGQRRLPDAGRDRRGRAGPCRRPHPRVLAHGDERAHDLRGRRARSRRGRVLGRSHEGRPQRRRCGHRGRHRPERRGPGQARSHRGVRPRPEGRRRGLGLRRGRRRHRLRRVERGHQRRHRHRHPRRGADQRNRGRGHRHLVRRRQRPPRGHRRLVRPGRGLQRCRDLARREPHRLGLELRRRRGRHDHRRPARPRRPGAGAPDDRLPPEPRAVRRHGARRPQHRGAGRDRPAGVHHRHRQRRRPTSST